MRRVIGIVALLVVLSAGLAFAQDNLFGRTTRWNVTESWNDDRLVYTFQPDGTFRSSLKTDKSYGNWMRSGRSFVMVWPAYDYAVYVGTIERSEIRGAGFSKEGKSFGTFTFKLIP